MKKMTRMESNKEARRVLNKHGVDLGYCQYSCCGMNIMLGGWLCKHDGSDFNGAQIQAMIVDFQRVLQGFTISGDFDNWQFNSESISFIGDKKEDSDTSRDSEEDAERYEISEDYEQGVG
jgi:hypothetical protein